MGAGPCVIIIYCGGAKSAGAELATFYADGNPLMRAAATGMSELEGEICDMAESIGPHLDTAELISVHEHAQDAKAIRARIRTFVRDYHGAPHGVTPSADEMLLIADIDAFTASQYAFFTGLADKYEHA